MMVVAKHEKAARKATAADPPPRRRKQARKATKAAAEQPEPRREQVRWAGVGLAISTLVAIGFALTAMFTHPKVVRLRSPGQQRAQQRVQAAGAEMARAWHPADRARLVERLRASEDQDEMRRALGVALRKPDTKMRKALLDVASALQVQEVRYDVANMGAGGGGGPDTVTAIGVAHQLRPYRKDEAGELIATGGRDVRFAVLNAIGKLGGELPDDVLLHCLTSDDDKERELALGAFPRQPSLEVQRELVRLAKNGAPHAAAQALRALARCDDAAAHIELAGECLHDRPGEVRRAALEFLRDVTAADNVEQIWTVVADAAADEKLRLFALHCVEHLGGIDLETLTSQIAMMSPAERLLAARCLMRAGDEHAVDILLGLIGVADGSPVVESSRRLLAWLTGVSAGATPAEFRAAFDRSGRRMRTRFLPEHRL